MVALGLLLREEFVTVWSLDPANLRKTHAVQTCVHATLQKIVGNIPTQKVSVNFTVALFRGGKRRYSRFDFEADDVTVRGSGLV